MYFSDYKDWGYGTQQAIKYVRGKTLDLRCGAGRVGLYLQRKKIDHLGIDNSPLAVKVCKLRGEAISKPLYRSLTVILSAAKDL